jgi:hypothetical protein
VKTAQAFKGGDAGRVADDLLVPGGYIDSDCTILRDMIAGEEVAITPFKEWFRFHSVNGWDIVSPFDAVSAHLNESANG